MALSVSTVREIEWELIRHANKKWWALLFHAKYDKEKVQAWKLDLQKTLAIFNVRYIAQSARSMVSE